MAATAMTLPRTSTAFAQHTVSTQRSRQVCGAASVTSASCKGPLSATAQPATFTVLAPGTPTRRAHNFAAPTPATAAAMAAGCVYELQPPQCSVLEQFAAVPDYPKLIRALTLVSCGNLRSPATALLGLALLEEATQQPYDLISLE